MRSVHFDPDGAEDFLFRLGSDREMARRITRPIGEVQRDPFADDKEPKILKARYHHHD